MDSVRVAYMWAETVCSLALLILAMIAPVWITPGYYWWTAFLLLMFFSGIIATNKRLNSWGPVIGDLNVLDDLRFKMSREKGLWVEDMLK